MGTVVSLFVMIALSTFSLLKDRKIHGKTNYMQLYRT